MRHERLQAGGVDEQQTEEVVEEEEEGRDTHWQELAGFLTE